MENREFLYAAASYLVTVMSLGIQGYAACRFLRPFLTRTKGAAGIGIAYIGVMLLLYHLPWDMWGMLAYGVGACTVCGVSYWLDRRNLRQKIYLAVTLYLVNWITHGIAIIPRSVLLDGLNRLPTDVQNGSAGFGLYVCVEIVYLALRLCIQLLLIGLLDRFFVDKRANMTGQELLFTMAPCLTTLAGYGLISFYSEAYLKDTEQYIWRMHEEYQYLELAYQLVSYGAILLTLLIYQKMRQYQREEREHAALAGQLEDMKQHIRQVEGLHREIRGMKHDMGNHVTVLENLILQDQQEEAAQYLAMLKNRLQEVAWEVRSGNPVTDVILSQKQREASEQGIRFRCEFFYPQGNINAFDMSIILNNALSNAIEAAAGCREPYVCLRSCSRKNAYLIDIVNSYEGCLTIDEESRLPATTKGAGHGFGLRNIRRVAEKYQGDMDICQEGGSVRLSVMLILR